jgi:hypothetical protein
LVSVYDAAAAGKPLDWALRDAGLTVAELTAAWGNRLRALTG